MAAKTVAIDDAATVERWSKRVGTEAIWKSIFFRKDYGFVGSGNDRMIVQKEEFSDQIGGNQLTCTLTMQLTGDGPVDGAPAEGLEADFSHFTDTFEVHELGSEPAAIKSQQDQQHVPWDLVNQAKNITSDWWEVPLNTGPAMHFAGSTFSTAVDYYKPHGRSVRAGTAGGLGNQYTGMNAVTTPTASRHLWAGAQANDESLTSGHTFALDDVDELIDRAPQMKPPIRPCKWAGGEHYIIFLHQDQYSDLITDTRYKEINVALLQGGTAYEKSVFGTGNAIPYRNAIFVTSLWNPPGQNSSTAAGLANTRRAFLCGAQAGCVGWGKGHGQNRFRWHNERYNLGGGVRMIARSIWGFKKTIFNSKDYGCLVYSTYAANRGDA